MRTAKIIKQEASTPDYPYNVQIWQDRTYSGEGRFFKEYGEALAWALNHADVFTYEKH